MERWTRGGRRDAAEAAGPALRLERNFALPIAAAARTRARVANCTASRMAARTSSVGARAAVARLCTTPALRTTNDAHLDFPTALSPSNTSLYASRFFPAPPLTEIVCDESPPALDSPPPQLPILPCNADVRGVQDVDVGGG